MIGSYRTRTLEAPTPMQRVFGKVWPAITNNSEGGTVPVSGGDVPRYGYMVGGGAPELTVNMGPLNDPNQRLRRYERIVDWVRGAVTDYPDASVGWWKDTETGLYHLDVAEWYESEEQALTVAAERGEKAIWDLGNGEKIRLS